MQNKNLDYQITDFIKDYGFKKLVLEAVKITKQNGEFKARRNNIIKEPFKLFKDNQIIYEATLLMANIL